MTGKATFVIGAGLALTALVLGPSLRTQAQTTGCTLTQGFWKNHPEAWPVDTILIGGVSFTRESALGLLKAPPRGDAGYILVHQLIAAKLNVLNGADDSSIAAAIDAADAWFASHAIGTPPTGEDRETAVMLAGQLDAFNNGLAGPPHCDDPGPSPTPTPTPTPDPDPV